LTEATLPCAGPGVFEVVVAVLAAGSVSLLAAAMAVDADGALDGNAGTAAAADALVDTDAEGTAGVSGAANFSAMNAPAVPTNPTPAMIPTMIATLFFGRRAVASTPPAADTAATGTGLGSGFGGGGAGAVKSASLPLRSNPPPPPIEPIGDGASIVIKSSSRFAGAAGAFLPEGAAGAGPAALGAAPALPTTPDFSASKENSTLFSLRAPVALE
jgi:hypothetical protein